MKIPFILTIQLLAAVLVLSIVCATAGSASDPTNQVESDVSTSKHQDATADCATLPGFRGWSDQTVKPSAALLCIHGLGLNSDAFDDFGTRMAHNGVLVFAFDVRGFGAWTKTKDGESLDFEGTLCDIKQTLSTIRADHPGLPVFLLGESMGGAIVLKACSQFPQLIDGLISSAPGGQRYKQGKTDLEVGLRVLTRPLKQFDIGTGIVDQATKDPALRKVWQCDPLNRLDLSPVQLIKFQLFMDGSDGAVRKIDCTPVLVLQGTLDKLVEPSDTWKIFTILATERKTMIALRSEHLVLEYGRVKSDFYNTKVSQMVANWIRDTISHAGADDDASAH